MGAPPQGTATAYPHDILAIRNVMARYCEALDLKAFNLLDRVFTPDATGDYPFNPDLKGVEGIRNAIQQRLGPIATHHSLTTQSLLINPSPAGSSSHVLKTANATTYFIAAHFGQGRHEGKLLTAYGRYIDELVCLVAEGQQDEGCHGATGVWRIKRRTVSFTGRVGDEAIMREF